MTPRNRLRHLRDSYGRPVKIFDEVRSATASAPLSDADKDRAKRVATLITTLHIHETTKGKSALK